MKTLAAILNLLMAQLAVSTTTLSAEPDPKAALQKAVALVQTNHFAEARDVMEDVVQVVAKLHGEDHPAYAAALFQQASLMAVLEEWKLGAALCHKASSIKGRDQQSEKDRLTYGMNEAEFLQIAGELKQALKVIEENVLMREQFYGKDHSGYAYGLAELAAAQLRADMPRQALKSASQAVEIDFKNKNPHMSLSLLMQGIAAVSAGLKDQAFESWVHFPAEQRHGVVEELTAHYRKFPAAMLVEPLVKLAERCQEHPTSVPSDRATVLAMLSNFARECGQHETRVEALRQLQLLQSDGQPKVELYKALSIALKDAGREEAGLAMLDKAIAHAIEKQLPEAEADALRDKAIALAEAKRMDDAEQAHQRSVQAARGTKNAKLTGRALAAYGIFLHHQNKISAALAQLEEALTVLPQDDEHFFYLLNHVVPARKGEGCRCQVQGPDTIAMMLKEALVKEVGDGLVAAVELGPDGKNYQLKLLRAFQDQAEEKKLSNAWENVYGTLRKRLMKK